MLHIDGTTCNGSRKGMPGRTRIAYYWRETSFAQFGYLMDWGEPSCWACGIWDGTLDIDLTNLTGFEVFKVWESHNYLQRCHIVPKSLGGCSCEANLVLLCHRCHKASPDSKDPIHFIKWVRNKKNLGFQEIKDAMTLLEYKAEYDDWKILLSDGFKKYLYQNSVLVGGHISTSSFVACFIEYKAQTKPQLNSNGNLHSNSTIH